MTDDIVISARNLTKTYRAYAHPLDQLLGSFIPGRAKRCKEFHALNDVSFDIRRGETVGIIGRHGSGKSTLLQLICGIRKPTSGTLQVNGRISALLELGAGFHPEFTGRENVFMQGAIQGMSRQEMEARFDDIAAFADIGEYIDQPVKTYSSGMFVRLAFAVAVSVEPDILVVDEALGVGDEAFQRKCLGRIEALRDRGVTVLFVSHSAKAVSELCQHVYLLYGGQALLHGAPKYVLDWYHKLIFTGPGKEAAVIEEIKQARLHDEQPTNEKSQSVQDADYDPDLITKSKLEYESEGARISSPRFLDTAGRSVNILRRGQEYDFVYDVEFDQESELVRFSMLIKTALGFELGGMISHPAGEGLSHVEQGQTTSDAFRFRCALLPGVYFLNAGVVGRRGNAEEFLHRVIDAYIFRVEEEFGLQLTSVVDFSVWSQNQQVSPVRWVAAEDSVRVGKIS